MANVTERSPKSDGNLQLFVFWQLKLQSIWCIMMFYFLFFSAVFPLYKTHPTFRKNSAKKRLEISSYIFLTKNPAGFTNFCGQLALRFRHHDLGIHQGSGAREWFDSMDLMAIICSKMKGLQLVKIVDLAGIFLLDPFSILNNIVFFSSYSIT